MPKDSGLIPGWADRFNCKLKPFLFVSNLKNLEVLVIFTGPILDSHHISKPMKTLESKYFGKLKAKRCRNPLWM